MELNVQSKEYYVVVKNKKYLSGYSYASPNHIQYSYNWSKDLKDAMKFDIHHSDADHFAGQTNGNIKLINQK